MSPRPIVAIAAGAALVVAVPGAAAADTAPDPITVPAVEGLNDDFMLGVDVSSVLSLEESGVVFRDDAGTPADLFDVLTHHGVSDVRIRVWNDPFDASGRGYGGGNVDVDRALEIGQRADAAGLGVVVDFHYSDFWADPGKQHAPKAWAGYTVDETANAVHDFTADALTRFVDAGIDVTMVQIGNETNNGVAGVSGWDDMAEVFQAGSAAVREAAPDALVALHFTNPETAGRYDAAAAALDARGVEYDVFASSYYPYWHGSLDNLTSVLSRVADTYGKKVAVVETSWVHTLDDADGHENTISEASEAMAFPISVQGQATAFREVVQAVANVGDAGIGVFSWEPAWLPVGSPDELETNKQKWEQYGSGWATSFAATYDPDDAGRWFGGTAVDNEALFSPDGTPLPSLRVFEYVRTGATGPVVVTDIERVALVVDEGDDVLLPSSLRVRYSDGTDTDEAVEWQTPSHFPIGVHTVEGTTATGHAVTASITVRERSYLPGGGFEGDGAVLWSVDGTGGSIGWQADSVEGENALHFWHDSDFAGSASQTVSGLQPGRYAAIATSQGAIADADAVTLTATATPTHLPPQTSDRARAAQTRAAEAPLEFDGWRAYATAQTPTVQVKNGADVTVEISWNLTAESWGTIDDVRLIRVG